MKGLDTNVLVRYLVQDDPRQSKKAAQFIESQCTREQPGVISNIVLCETLWVLESCYDINKKRQAEVVEEILSVAELQITNTELVWQALRDFQANKVDFADCLSARQNYAEGCDVTFSFNKKAAVLPLFRLL